MSTVPNVREPAEEPGDGEDTDGAERQEGYLDSLSGRTYTW